MAGYRDIGSSGRRRGVVEATAAVCKLSVMTVGRGGKVLGVAPRPGDGWDAGGSTRMVLVQMSWHVLEVKLIGGEHNGQLALIPQITLCPVEGQTGFVFVLKRRQFSVHLTFTLTINKAQGQSVKHVGIDLRLLVFLHGQL